MKTPVGEPSPTAPAERVVVGGGSRPGRRALLGLALGVGALVVRAVIGQRPELVEGYATHVFPRVATVLSACARRVPFSLAELGLALLVLEGVRRICVAVGRWRRGAGVGSLLVGGAARAVFLAGLTIAGFIVVWGMHYERAPLAMRLGLALEPANSIELAELARELSAIAGEARAGLPEDVHGVLRLQGDTAATCARAAGALDHVARQVPELRGAPIVHREALLSPLLTLLGITGIYSPFTGEAHVNGSIPTTSLPFVACHEGAHARGVAPEEEANFVAWLACSRSADPEFVYCGAAWALSEAMAALLRADPRAWAEVNGALPATLLRDRAAAQLFWQRSATPVRRVGRVGNDTFLKAQGVRDGVRSYGRMVDLLLAERRAARGLWAERRRTGAGTGQ